MYYVCDECQAPIFLKNRLFIVMMKVPSGKRWQIAKEITMFNGKNVATLSSRQDGAIKGAFGVSEYFAEIFLNGEPFCAT